MPDLLISDANKSVLSLSFILLYYLGVYRKNIQASLLHQDHGFASKNAKC